MPAYESELFDPPAPLARITLRAVSSRKTITNVPMLIDSGSDITLVSAAVIAGLGSEMSSDERVDLEAFDGTVTQAATLELDLVFLGVTFRGHLPVVNSPVGVLGTNVLNRFAILLDGPTLNWERLNLAVK